METSWMDNISKAELVKALAKRNETIGQLRAEYQKLMVAWAGAVRLQDEYKARIAELEAAINGCAGQWTPMAEGAHYCGCDEETCTGEWRIENNGSRLVIGDGESELSIEFYEAIRVCWQVQP